MKIPARLLHSTAMGVALMLAAGAVGAQQQAQTDQNDNADQITLGTVVIRQTNTDGTPVYAGENETNLNAEAIASTSSVDQLLRNQASVTTRFNPGQAGVAVNIRGFEGSGRVAVTVDGVPQNFRFTGHEASGFAYFDENLLAGVDIARGGSLTTVGAGLAGSVGFRTIGVDDLIAAGEDRGSMVRLGYGENGDDWSTMIATGFRSGNFDMMAAISARDSGDYDNGDGNTVLRSGKDIRSALLKGAYHLDPTQSLSFSLMHYDADFGANSYFQTVTNNQFTLGYRYQPDDPLIDLRSNLYVGKTESEYTDATGSFGSAVGRVMGTRTWGANTSNTSRLALGQWDLVSTNGFDFSRDDLSGTNTGINPSDGRTDRLALYSENIFTLNDLEVMAGLRVNSYKTKNDTPGRSVDIDHTSVDPRISIAYTFMDTFQPYATWQRTSRTPTLQETLLGGTHPGETSATMIPNPDLEPEESDGYELGVNITRGGLLTVDDRLTARVNYYRMNVENYITGAFGFTNSYGQTGAALVNIPGKSHVSGVEIEANYRSERFSLGLAYDDTDSKLPAMMSGFGASSYLPDDRVTATVAGHFLEGALTVGLRYSYTSGGKVSGFDATGAVPVQTETSYELVDVFGSYDVTEDIVLNFRIDNLFNKTYSPWNTTSDGTDPAMKGRGRTAYLGAQLRF